MHGFELGSLDLVDSFPSDDGYTIRVTSEGTTFGSFEAVVRSVVSMLADGNQVKYDRAGNRVASFPVQIEGADGLALAMGEAALRAELYRPNTIKWTPPSDFAPPTVFEVLTSYMDPEFDDIAETRTTRTFKVTLTCAPFARSADLTIAEPLSVGGSPVATVFDNCDSETGWSGTIDGAPAAATTFWEAGAIGIAVFDNPDGDADTLTITRTGAVDFTGTPYLIVEAWPLSADRNFVALADGTPLPLLSQRDLGSGHQEFTLLAPATANTLTFVHVRPAGDPWAGLRIYDLTKSNMPPGASPKQLSRIIPTGGTERTPASIRLSSQDGTDLGLAFVHTSPEDGTGYDPSLRRRRSSGNTETTDATTISGKREALGGVFNVFDIPDTSLPEGGYALIGLFRATEIIADGSIQVIADTFQGADSLGEIARDVPVSMPANDWTLIDLGVYSLPTARTVSGATFRIAIAGPAEIEYDELWLFRVDGDCALTIVLTDKGNLWLDSPTVDDPSYRLWEGDDETRAGARFPARWYTMGQHVLSQPATRVFTATSGAEYPDVSASRYKRWPNNAAE